MDSAREWWARLESFRRLSEGCGSTNVEVSEHGQKQPGSTWRITQENLNFGKRHSLENKDAKLCKAEHEP